jgi:hypothetical protein
MLTSRLRAWSCRRRAYAERRLDQPDDARTAVLEDAITATFQAVRKRRCFVER